ncbi:hypothetical protein [Streptomyces sp. TLI_185]|uniref:hypothetical protein n=1 Tax=Streptomyces sp. TLI_185 TaxID=2485151 RepID=UPI000F5046FD|nr:hypothetical protein [Streptomyces sp. TLI_185]RPF38238.1 hypothetical protein EDD92_8366 [Streptomyces sp. TLI_185]
MSHHLKNEFKFVVTGVELTEDQQQLVGRAIAQAAAPALGELAPRAALPVAVNPKVWWYGDPAKEVLAPVQDYAAGQVGMR